MDGETVLAGGLSGLLDRIGHFVGFAKSPADLALGIARDDEGTEAEAATAFDDLGATIDMNDFFNAIHFAWSTVITTTEAAIRRSGGGRWGWGRSLDGNCHFGLGNYCFISHNRKGCGWIRISGPFHGRRRRGL